MPVISESDSTSSPARMRVKVSIVIPVYNAGNLLRIMMDSILKQTERSFEVILIDDGSNDGGRTEAVIGEYAGMDGRVRVFRQENRGVSATRDLGVQRASGRFVYVCDQDDYLHPQMLEFCLWACEKHDLDYLKITHQFGSVNATSRLAPIRDFGEIPVDVVDNAGSDGETVGRALGELHTDAWAQFLKRDLALKFPSGEYDVAAAFYRVDSAARWGVEHTPLYYYHGDIESSMIHKAIAPGWIDILHRGWRRVYDLYAKQATNEHGKTVLHHICAEKISSQLKVIFHMVKRLNKPNSLRTSMDVWARFGEMAADFLFVRRLTVEMIGIKHYCEYLAVALFLGVPHMICKGLKGGRRNP